MYILLFISIYVYRYYVYNKNKKYINDVLLKSMLFTFRADKNLNF